MEILQWLFFIGVASSIIFLIFALYSLVMIFRNRRRIRQVERESKQKRKKKQILRLNKQRKKALIRFISFFVMSILFGFASGYIGYYQATNLSKEDTQNITDGFYYLRDLENELKNAQKESFDEEKSSQMINYVVTSLAGYSIKKVNPLNTVEGQSILNRYYQSMAELGINISRQSASLLKDEKKLKEAIEDIEKVKERQKKVFIFYKVDSKSLDSEK